MQKQRPTAHSIIRKVREAELSPLYLWMTSNYEEMVAASARRRVGGWADLVRDFEALGLLDGSGKPPSVQSARKTWSRVKSDAGNAEAQVSKAARPAPPSRQRADWQPPLAASQSRPELRTPPSRQPATETLPRAGPVEGTGNADAKLAAAKRQFAWMDRHIVQQSDED